LGLKFDPPQTSYSALLTLQSLAASVFDTSSATIHSAISQPCPALKQYHQLVHDLNSLLVWFQRRVWSADGAVCDDITPCLIGSKMVGLGGAIFTSSRPAFGTAVAKKRRPCAPSWSGVAVGAAQVPNWLLPSQKWQRCQCDASMMHRTLNSLINTINYNYF
jgi:hypothetical protein